MSTQSQRLASEEVVVQAPMSFSGSARRIWKLTRAATWLIPIAILLIAFAWLAVLGWYVIFGLLLVPYRVIRRGDRNRKRQARQHRELLAQLGDKRDS